MGSLCFFEFEAGFAIENQFGLGGLQLKSVLFFVGLLRKQCFLLWIEQELSHHLVVYHIFILNCEEDLPRDGLQGERQQFLEFVPD
jgi:hypothetical protein